MQGGEQKKRAKKDPRAHVIEATLDLIHRQPFGTVGIRQIADATGMSPGHILYYFGSKDDLWFETWLWNEEASARRRRLEFSRMESAVERLNRLIEGEAPVGPRDPNWLLYCHVLARQTDDEQMQRVAYVEMAWLSDVGEIIEYGMKRGEFVETDPEQFAISFLAFLDGLSLNVVTGYSRITRESMIELALDVAARELGFPRAPSS